MFKKEKWQVCELAKKLENPKFLKLIIYENILKKYFFVKTIANVKSECPHLDIQRAIQRSVQKYIVCLGVYTVIYSMCKNNYRMSYK